MLQLQTAQRQLFITVNSTLIIFRKSFLINFYVRILHRIALLICNIVLVVYQSSESDNIVQIVSKYELNTLVASKKVGQTPSPIPDPHSARNRERKTSSLVYFKPKFGTPYVSPHQHTSS